MIRKHLLTVLLSCGLLLAVSGATADRTISPDMQRILSKKKIVVAMISEDIPPFIFPDEEGNLQGFDVDLARGIAATLGVEVEFSREAPTYNGVVAAVAERKADIAVSFLSATPDRAITVGFSEPYFMAYNAFLINRLKLPVRKADVRPEELLNSEDVVIGVLAASAYVEFAARDYPRAKTKGYKSWNEAAEAAVKGEIHAAFFDDVDVLAWIHDHPEEALYVKPVVLRSKPDPISVVVHWEDTHLLFWLNLYLNQVSSDGTLTRLHEKYLGTPPEDAKDEKKQEDT